MVYLAKNIVNKRTVSFFAKIVGSHLKAMCRAEVLKPEQTSSNPARNNEIFVRKYETSFANEVPLE